jgi:transposase
MLGPLGEGGHLVGPCARRRGHHHHHQHISRLIAQSLPRPVLDIETQSDYGSQWEAIVSVAQKVGVSAESLRRWVRQAEIDAGARAGTTSTDAQALRELRRENRELRRANEILKAAATFFARELDPRLPRS